MHATNLIYTADLGARIYDTYNSAGKYSYRMDIDQGLLQHYDVYMYIVGEIRRTLDPPTESIIQTLEEKL